MIQTILTVSVSTITGSVIGYLISMVKKYKEKFAQKNENEKLQNTALQALLKGQLTNTYFVYNELKKIPDYAYQNFLDMLQVYESLDGDGFIHTIARKMESWEITKTDILK